MKKIISIVLSMVMLICTASIGFSAEAASKPAKVKGVSMVTKVDNYRMKAKTTIKWKKVKGASGYQLKLGDGPYDGIIYYTKKTVNGASKTSIKYNEEYAASTSYSCVKIRAYKIRNGKKVYGKWSKLTEIRIKNIN